MPFILSPIQEQESSRVLDKLAREKGYDEEFEFYDRVEKLAVEISMKNAVSIKV